MVRRKSLAWFHTDICHLYFLGLIVAVNLDTIRIPGVLQRFSLTYLVLGLLEVCFCRYDTPEKYQVTFQRVPDWLDITNEWAWYFQLIQRISDTLWLRTFYISLKFVHHFNVRDHQNLGIIVYYIQPPLPKKQTLVFYPNPLFTG